MRKKVPWMKKAENMRECVASLDNGPLYDENFDIFYTPFPNPYRKDIVEQLNYKLGAPSLTKHKFILAGHRGVGKSTELLRVSRICNGYRTVFVNSADAMGPKGTGYTNLLVLIADKVMKFGIDSKFLDENDTVFNPLINYWDSELSIKKTVQDIESRNETLNVGAELSGSLSTSFGILDKLKTVITIGTKIDAKTEKKDGQTSTVDEIIHTTIDKNDMLFVQALNVIIKKIETYMLGERLLIIIEELDKAGQFELASDVFKEHVKAFSGIEADMIFTYPTHLQYDPEYSHVHDIFNGVFKLSVVELVNEYKCYDDNVIETFKELIYKRISQDLINDLALVLAIKMSGGLIRDVFTLLSEAAVIAGVDAREKITVSDVEKAVTTLKDRYIKVIDVDNGFDELVGIYNVPRRQVDPKLRKLLRAEVVLEYSNSRYVVHPVVLKFLKEIGKGVEEYE